MTKLDYYEKRLARTIEAKRATLTITRCTDCRTAWTTDLEGQPISWLGEWAATRHHNHHLTTSRLT